MLTVPDDKRRGAESIYDGDISMLGLPNRRVLAELLVIIRNSDEAVRRHCGSVPLSAKNCIFSLAPEGRFE